MIVYGRSNGKALRSALNSVTEVRNGYIYAAATGECIAKRQYNNDEPTGSVIDNAGKLRKQESKEGIKTAGNTRQTKADHTKPKAAAVVT